MDLTTASDGELSALRQDLAREQDRRRKLEQLPEDLAAMAREAVRAGCDPDALLERVSGALTDEQETTR